MKKLITDAIILSFALSVILIAISGCGGRDINKPEELEPVEIREYESI